MSKLGEMPPVAGHSERSDDSTVFGLGQPDKKRIDTKQTPEKPAKVDPLPPRITKDQVLRKLAKRASDTHPTGETEEEAWLRLSEFQALLDWSLDEKLRPFEVKQTELATSMRGIETALSNRLDSAESAIEKNEEDVETAVGLAESNTIAIDLMETRLKNAESAIISLTSDLREERKGRKDIDEVLLKMQCQERKNNFKKIVFFSKKTKLCLIL